MSAISTHTYRMMGKEIGHMVSRGAKIFKMARGQLDERNLNRAIFLVESGSVENVLEKKELSYQGQNIRVR